jgi:hypothetical protein
MKFRFLLLPEDEPERPEPDTGTEVTNGWLPTLRYEQRGETMVRHEQPEKGCSRVRAVTNFAARIVRDIVVDDGETEQRNFGVEAEIDGRRIAFSVPVAEFGRMRWVLDKLGPQAIIYPGQQAHARAAIQYLSGQVRQERVFTHLGWKLDGGKWVYLHAAGALGADGPVVSFKVRLPAMQNFQLQSLEDPAEQVMAVRASLQFLSLAPDRITFPLLAAVYRAPFGKIDFSLFLAGHSGVFKTALAALCQQHFGPTMDVSGLPASFSSTENALEWLAFEAKDALLVVDDFVPTGDGGLQKVAERLFRASGNQQGRSRLGGGGQLMTSRPPRALVLATGEEVPRGESIRARMLIVPVTTGEVDRAGLSACQQAAQEGRLSASMGTFLVWVAGRYEPLQERIGARAKQLRNLNSQFDAHARLPTTLAELQAGWEIFLEFAQEAGAINKVESKELAARSERALNQLAVLQCGYRKGSDPASQFVNLLGVGLACGRAHVADRTGGAPRDAAVWGWRRKHTGREWVPLGIRIGWLSGNDLFLDPKASYALAQELSGRERIWASEQALRHMLRERRLLASIDKGRQMVQVRRTLEGAARQVLHMKVSELAMLLNVATG